MPPSRGSVCSVLRPVYLESSSFRIPHPLSGPLAAVHGRPQRLGGPCVVPLNRGDWWQAGGGAGLSCSPFGSLYFALGSRQGTALGPTDGALVGVLPAATLGSRFRLLVEVMARIGAFLCPLGSLALGVVVPAVGVGSGHAPAPGHANPSGLRHSCPNAAGDARAMPYT